MGFYTLSKDDRAKLVIQMRDNILSDIRKNKQQHILAYFSNEDTYIRKNGYIATGRIYKEHKELQSNILSLLDELVQDNDPKVRQTAINAAGEIGMHDFPPIEYLMRIGLFDGHHIVRNAVIGSIKKMSEKNPVPTLAFAKQFLHHEDKEIRREICHGIELRGRTHPQDILLMLKELQHDKTARVRNTLVHVLGQIAYKKGCLATVIEHLRTWENKELVNDAIEEIIDVHDRYKDFAVLTQEQARNYINRNFNP